jgi:hypothetical protein
LEEPTETSSMIGAPVTESTEEEAVTAFQEKRFFNKGSGLTEEEAMIVAEWFGKNPEIRDLVVAWARARLSDELSGVEADLLEFDAKAKASYLLANLQRKEKKKIPRGR